jgi:hypothetical protein
MRTIMLAALLGCAHAPTVTNENVVQLPAQARVRILDAQRSVDAADQNLTAAKVALDESRRFRDIADRELDSARAHADASEQALDLAGHSHVASTLSAARQDREVAMRQLFAARAKKDYAVRLVELRRAELELKRAELEQAHADVEYTKLAALREHGLAANYRESDFVDARERARTNVADARGKEAALAGSVEALRTSWLQRENEYRTASRSVSVPPPPAPQALPPPAEGAPAAAPAPGVNEGPSAPQSFPESYPRY